MQAMENSAARDYVSEKLYDAFTAGCVPLYMGAPNVNEYIPSPSAIINYDTMGGSVQASAGVPPWSVQHDAPHIAPRLSIMCDMCAAALRHRRSQTGWSSWQPMKKPTKPCWRGSSGRTTATHPVSAVQAQLLESPCWPSAACPAHLVACQPQCWSAPWASAQVVTLVTCPLLARVALQASEPCWRTTTPPCATCAGTWRRTHPGRRSRACRAPPTRHGLMPERCAAEACVMCYCERMRPQPAAWCA
jgi:hypothetical protein